MCPISGGTTVTILYMHACIYMYSATSGEDGATFYYIYGVAVTEVELDVLTGLIQIPRVDILYDCGERC